MFDVLGAASGEEDQKVECKRIIVRILAAGHIFHGIFTPLSKTL